MVLPILSRRRGLMTNSETRIAQIFGVEKLDSDTPIIHQVDIRPKDYHSLCYLLEEALCLAPGCLNIEDFQTITPRQLRNKKSRPAQHHYL